MWDYLKEGAKAWYGDHDHVTVNEEEIEQYRRNRKYKRNMNKRLEARKRGGEQKFGEAQEV